MVSSLALDKLSVASKNGCAAERYLPGLCGVELKNYANYLVGVDLSPNMIEQTRSRGIYDDVAVADVTEYLETQPAAYDIAVAAEVLVYIGDSATTFSVVRDALVTGGWFVFSIEVSEQAGFRAESTGRFVHHPDYIRHLASQSQFSVVAEHHTVLRKQLTEDVAGMIFVLQAE